MPNSYKVRRRQILSARGRCRVGGAHTLRKFSSTRATSTFGANGQSLRPQPANGRINSRNSAKISPGWLLRLRTPIAPIRQHYTDEEIVYRVAKPKHVGLIFYSKKQKRVDELLEHTRTALPQTSSRSCQPRSVTTIDVLSQVDNSSLHSYSFFFYVLRTALRQLRGRRKQLDSGVWLDR
jgi:hypothetical protein